MPVDLYYTPGSGPARSVLMTGKAIGIEFNLKELDLQAGEHLTPEFIKINPQHTVPTIVDNGFALWESRAIQTYLADKYGKDDTLYPKDPQKRAVVNQRMWFDIGTLYQALADYYYPQIFAKAPADPEKLKKLESAFEFLDLFLANSTYAAGEKITLADITLVSTVSTAELAKFDVAKYPNVARWLAKCKKTVPGYELNEAGLQIFKRYLN